MLRTFSLYIYLLLFLAPAHANDLIFKSFPAIEAIDKTKIVKIVEDKSGFIWFATESNVYRFDAYDVVDINDLSKSPQVLLNNINDIAFDTNNNLLILTDKVLLTFNHELITKVSWYTEELQAKKIITLPDQILLITNKGVVSVHDSTINTTLFVGDFTPPFMVKNYHLDNSKNGILIATKRALFSYGINNKIIVQARFDPELQPFLWDVHIDSNDNTWVSTDFGLYKKNSNSNQWQHFQPEGFPAIIKTIESDSQYIWFASALNGLFGLENSTGKWFNSQNSEQTNSLKSNNLSNLFIDSKKLLWVSTFEANLLVTDRLYPSLEEKSECIQQKYIYHISALDQKLYMAIDDGVIIKTEDHCQLLQTSQPIDGRMHGFVPTFIFPESEQIIWLGSDEGIHQLNGQDSNITDYYINNEIDSVTFISRLNSTALLFATSSQLYVLNPVKKSTEVLKFTNLSGIRFYDSLRHQNKQYLATSMGLFELTNNFQLIAVDDGKDFLSSLSILTLDSVNESLILGTQYDGLYTFSLDDNELNRLDSTGEGFTNITNIIHHDNQVLWITSNLGLSRFDLNSKSHITINEHRGLTTNKFIDNSAQLHHGRLYFGTQSGVIGFNPLEIPSYTENHSLVFTGLKTFNERVQVNSESGSMLQKPLNTTNKLVLKHSDLSISIGFSALNFINPDHNYYYQLQGFDPIWITVNEDNRQATYTKLPTGNYEFTLKSSLISGPSNPNEFKSIFIQVLPPPWLTWWALSSYVLLFIGVVYWYIQRKIKTNELMATMLRIEVKAKTKELKIQKQTVDSLLAKKNELFSNVSHEFRTPLTLILGPIKDLINNQVDAEDINSLKMVNRNANRLLSLVEQLLQIARVSDLQNIHTSAQKTHKQVKSLVDSFQHMALNKKLSLQLIDNDQATIKVTEQFIDTVLGNLLSNAIKYTQSGGSIIVCATTNIDCFVLSVKDSGAGLTEGQQIDIFKRFKRLDSHQDIEGIGIGLSVVEEVVKINNGVIKVISELGVGSNFIITVPLSDDIIVTKEGSISSLVQQLQVEIVESNPKIMVAANEMEDSSLCTILVIEDNQDMRDHIVSIIKPHYNCLTAVNGLKGVAIAIEQIPDIIISDVMMPELDGFKVARVIRADQRTSHIPLMLLTALNDTTNRIKGWRENVDAYMTKPFDRDELLVQLDNMLTIRDILKKKAGIELSKGHDKTSILPKKDQQFVDRLHTVIKDNYQNPVLNREKIAKLMAVSDRQLQRKLKALIDQNPMDILREFRLNKAKELLNDGYQVSQIADDCGFNSLSYFSQCFKAQFGLSPKKYQQTNL